MPTLVRTYNDDQVEFELKDITIHVTYTTEFNVPSNLINSKSPKKFSALN